MVEIENKIEKRVEKIKLYDDILKIDFSKGIRYGGE